MANAPDLMSLLSLDPRFSSSPFGGNHRLILIEKDYTNCGDFVFNNLLQHFGRREPNTRILLITLSHDWLNYSASAAKCGFNLRKKQAMGNIDVINIMERYLKDVSNETTKINYCDYIIDQVDKFLTDPDSAKKTPSGLKRPPVIMLDDISLLLTIGCSSSHMFKMIMTIEQRLRLESEVLSNGQSSHFIIQTMFTNSSFDQSHVSKNSELDFFTGNIRNFSDLNITLRPLETGHSTRVDGTIKIIDNRLPLKQSSVPPTSEAVSYIMLPVFSGVPTEIGSKKAYFFKLSDRRVRLTSSALIF